jgi:hypothetical protein
MPAYRIQSHTRRKSAEMVTGYIREADKWTKSRLDGVGFRGGSAKRTGATFATLPRWVRGAIGPLLASRPFLAVGGETASVLSAAEALFCAPL